MISVWFFHVFIANNWEKCHGGGVSGRFIGPGGGDFEHLFCPGEFVVENSPIKKIARGFARGGGGGGWSDLELTDT